MTWIKICGITNLEDALVAVDAGADALGFVFHEKSTRHITAETVRVIAPHLPDKIERIGVFAGEIPKPVTDLLRDGSLTGMQMHTGGPSLTDRATGIPRNAKWYVALPASFFIEQPESARRFISSLKDVGEKMRALSADAQLPFTALFLDSSTLQQPGGTGKSFDWQQARAMADEIKAAVNLVVAGGLTPANVADAMDILKPWGVDVSSGVEASPGKKDAEKMRAFIKAVREADSRSAPR